jgi:putative molybdopterin biosynthesis protein
VAILPTGSELVPVGVQPLAGQIPEFNSIVLAAQVETWGGIPHRLPIVVDDLPALKARLTEAAAEHDLVLINAGSSAGSEDFSAQSIAELGEVLVHGVAVRPGHPVILGLVRRPESDRQDWVPVIGVPGFPVSAALTGEIFVEPLLELWQGIPPRVPATLEAVLTRKIHSSAGDDEYVRVTVGKVGPRWVAAPLSRGAGVLTSLVRADGLLVIPAGIQGHAAGESVTVRLYRNRAELERTIIALGSHDLTLDLLAQYLSARGRRLSSANLGSVGGLIALRRGEAHFAGSHLLDPETGTYNLPYLPQYLPETPVTVVALVERDQGLLVAKGNPKGIRQLQDLARTDIRFVNRQRGAGTRVLLDFELGKLGLPPERVRGYEQEEFTHLAVAAAISSGRADCGLGIRAAAAALDLDFLPIKRERYDLVIPEEHFASELLRPLRELLTDPGFRAEVGSLPGYHVEVMGQEMASTPRPASDVARPTQGRL